MSKIIKITDEFISELRNDFDAAIQDIKLSDGKFTFSKTIGSSNRKAVLWFTEIAWLKMLALVREFDKEVAWHGTAYRCGDMEKDEYIIKDVMVYPQEVTGSTVNTDQVKYQTWLYDHDDEVFNNIRMQGHSHVNMATSPSAVDITHQEQILSQLTDDMFYIFLIWNKRGEKTVKIYDMAKNVLFETGDVTVKIEDELGLESFVDEAKSMVTTKTYFYNNCYDPVNGIYTSYQTSGQAPASNGTQSGGSALKAPKSSATKSTKGDGKKKGKRKGRSATGNFDEGRYKSVYQNNVVDTLGHDDDADMDDPYGPFGYRDVWPQ